MTFLEHLDELRKRLVNVVVIVIVSFIFCWFVSDEIYDFLSIPIREALTEAEQNKLPVTGLSGDEKILALSDLKEGDRGRYVVARTMKVGTGVLHPGTTVSVIAAIDTAGLLALFTDEQLIAGTSVIPAGIRLPVDLASTTADTSDPLKRLIVTTATEPLRCMSRSPCMQPSRSRFR